MPDQNAAPARKSSAQSLSHGATGWDRFSCTLDSNGDGVPCVRAIGELDLSTVPQLEKMLFDAAAVSPRILLDLREVTFMDSYGLHLLIAATDRQRRSGGELVLGRGPAQVERLLEVSGTIELLEVIDLDMVPL